MSPAADSWHVKLEWELLCSPERDRKLWKTHYSSGFNRIADVQHLYIYNFINIPIFRGLMKVHICWQNLWFDSSPYRHAQPRFAHQLTLIKWLELIQLCSTAGPCFWLTGQPASGFWLTSCEQQSSCFLCWMFISVWPHGLPDTFRKRTLSRWDYLHKEGCETGFNSSISWRVRLVSRESYNFFFSPRFTLIQRAHPCQGFNRLYIQLCSLGWQCGYDALEQIWTLSLCSQSPRRSLRYTTFNEHMLKTFKIHVQRNVNTGGH